MGNKIISIFLRISSLAYLLLALYYFLGKKAGGGDEALFISDLQLISSSGWIAAIEKGISIPYMLLSYPIAQLVEPYIALRLVNILLFSLLVWYFYRIRQYKSLDFYALLFFFYSTVGYLLSGINDTLFIVSMVVFLLETQSLLRSKQKASLALWGSGLVVAFFTRELIVIFIPVILLAVFFLWKSKNGILKTLRIPVVVALILLLLNLPSLMQNKSLSYDKKLPPESTTVTWVQRQYLAQLLVNDGKLKNYNHPSWKETERYVDANGDHSLPRTVSEAMLFNPKLTVKEFFKDLTSIALYGSRQIGLMFLIVMFLLIRQVLKERRLSKEMFIPTVLLMTSGVFALIIISFVELRWMGGIFIATIAYFYHLIQQKRIPELVIQANYIIVVLLCWYGMYGMISKI